MKVFVLLVLSFCYCAYARLLPALTEAVSPQFLDQLLEENRYEEFEKYIGISVRNLSKPNEESRVHDPRRNEGLVEGDLLIRRRHTDEGRQGLSDSTRLWPGKPAKVPYEISSKFSSSKRRIIEESMEHWNERVSCIKFEPRANEKDYVHVFPGQGCYADLGFTTKKQVLSLGSGCLDMDTINHEMEHTAGVAHEHNREDRDKYIEMLWENIPDKWQSEFEKNDPEDYRLVGKYDYYSLMHYEVDAPETDPPLKAFNVRRRGIDESRIGKAPDFTDDDLQKLSALYC